MIDINEPYKIKIRDWLEILDLVDINIQKVIIAFTHPSYKGMVPNVEDYERFEFLGDAVLELISAEDLVRNSQFSEGIMTEKRKEIVNNEYLSQIFDQFNIRPMIRTALSYDPSLKDKANFVEALFGAIYLDKGLDKSRTTWNNIQKKMRLSKKRISLSEDTSLSSEQKQNKDTKLQFYKEIGLTPKNAKSMLQELCQKQNLPIPEYIQIDRIGPDHDLVFRVRVSVILFTRLPNLMYTAVGEGKSKKVAEMRTAEELCKQIFLDYILSD